jgi:hypothetical protein
MISAREKTSMQPRKNSNTRLKSSNSTKIWTPGEAGEVLFPEAFAAPPARLAMEAGRNIK